MEFDTRGNRHYKNDDQLRRRNYEEESENDDNGSMKHLILGFPVNQAGKEDAQGWVQDCEKYFKIHEVSQLMACI